MNADDKHITDRLQQLKLGATLVKRKVSGKKFARRFFLNEDEEFISYEKSRRIFGQPHICEYAAKRRL